MQIAIPKFVSIENIKDELLAAIEEFKEQWKRPTDLIILDIKLENEVCLFLEKQPQTLCLFQPASTKERQEAQREGVILCRLFINGVPCFASHVVNLPIEKDNEDYAEDKKFFEEYWYVQLI